MKNLYAKFYFIPRNILNNILKNEKNFQQIRTSIHLNLLNPITEFGSHL